MVTILNVTNNHDGTYTVQFSDNITNLNPGVDTPDPNVIFLTASNAGTPIAIFNADAVADTIVITATGGLTTCISLIILDQPITISSGSAFQVAAPILTVT